MNKTALALVLGMGIITTGLLGQRVAAQKPQTLAPHYVCTGKVHDKAYTAPTVISINPDNPTQFAMGQLNNQGEVTVRGFGFLEGADAYVALQFENTIGSEHFHIDGKTLTGKWSAYGLDTIVDETCTEGEALMEHPHVDTGQTFQAEKL